MTLNEEMMHDQRKTGHSCSLLYKFPFLHQNARTIRGRTGHCFTKRSM